MIVSTAAFLVATAIIIQSQRIERGPKNCCFFSSSPNKLFHHLWLLLLPFGCPQIREKDFQKTTIFMASHSQLPLQMCGGDHEAFLTVGLSAAGLRVVYSSFLFWGRFFISVSYLMINISPSTNPQAHWPLVSWSVGEFTYFWTFKMLCNALQDSFEHRWPLVSFPRFLFPPLIF